MKYNEWRDELKNNLLSVSESERAKVLDYYAEAYADRREAGFSESEIIAEFGAPFDAAQRILADAPASEAVKPSEKPVAPPPAPIFTPQTAAATNAGATAVAKKKSILGWLIPLICGAVVIAICIFALSFKTACNALKKFSTVTMTSYTAEEDYTAVKINAEMCSVRTEFYDGDKITVDYPVIKGYHWSISNADGDGLLTLSSNMPSNYLTFLGSVKIPDAVIKLPENGLFDIEVQTDAGSVTLAGGNYKNVKVDLDAGSFYADTIICESINCKIDAGSFCVDNITCNDLRCDINAGEIDIDELTCTTLTATVNMGSLEIGMTGAKSEYTISAVCNMGSSNLTTQTGSSDKKIDVTVSMGSLEVTFDN